MENAETGAAEEIDLEDGEIDESGAEEEVVEKPSAKPPAQSRKPSSSTSETRKSDQGKNENNKAARRKTDSAPDSSKANSSSSSRRKNEVTKRGNSSTSSRKREDEKDRSSRKAKRKSPDRDTAATFEDELNAYKSTQSNRNRRHSGEGSETSSSNNKRRAPRPPPPSVPMAPRNNKRRKDEPRLPKEKKVPCKFFMEGRCKNGNDCAFSHNIQQPKKLEVCKFYVGGYCSKGITCVYMHHDFPCKFFHTGQKCYSGDMCKFSHEDLSPDAKIALERNLEKESKDAYDRVAPKERERPPSPNTAAKKYTLLATPPREALLPTPEMTKRRAAFFRETLPDEPTVEIKHDHSVADQPPGHHEYVVQMDQNQMYQVPHITEYSHNGHQGPVHGMGSPAGSDTSNGSRKGPNDITKNLPKKQLELFMRLQQRAQQMSTRQQDVQVEEQAPQDEPEDNGFRPNNVNGYEQQDDIQPPSLTIQTHWTESDDEDDGGDQFLTNSLKRIQEEPNQGHWGHGQPYGGEPPYIPYDEFNAFDEAEQAANRGKVLLPPPMNFLPVQEGYEQYEEAPMYHPGAPAAPPMYQMPIAAPPPMPMQQQYMPDEYEDPNWNYQPYPLLVQQHISPPQHFAGPPMMNVLPHNQYMPPQVLPAVVRDPRLARNGPGDGHIPPNMQAPIMQQPPRSPETNSQPNYNAPPTLESVMQQLAKNLNSTVTQQVVAAPEIDAAMGKNPSPPLYKLEPTNPCKLEIQQSYKRLCGFRSEQEMERDPRLAKLMQNMSAEDIGKAKQGDVPSANLDSFSGLTTTPKEQSDPKKAALEFDAFTAILNEAMKAKKREADNDLAPVGKKTRRVTVAPVENYSH